MKNKVFKLIFFVNWLLIFGTLGCGSPVGKDAGVVNSVPLDPALNANQNTVIGAKGGSVTWTGVASIEFPENSFESDTNVTIKAASDPAEVQTYVETAVMSDVGPASPIIVRIFTPQQPRKAVTIRYNVPKDFLQTLEGQKFVPRLFAKFYQTGADDEVIDSYDPLPFDLSDGILTARIKPTGFTNQRPSGHNDFEAILVLGSESGNPIEVKKNFQIYKSAPNGVSNGCGSISLGAPLSSDLVVRSSFGPRKGPISGQMEAHDGVDLEAAVGDDVLAAADGTIDRIRFQFDSTTKRGFGQYVVIKHSDGSKTLYAHLLSGSTDSLQVGKAVKKGGVIGKADSTGGVTGPHLHFQYSPSGQIIGDDKFVIDPYPCIQYEPVKITSVVMGNAIFHPEYGVPFEVKLQIPPGNAATEKSCLSPNHECWAISPCGPYDRNKIRGCVDFTKPRGTLSVTYRIKDKYGNTSDFPFSVTWDCCNDSSRSTYRGMKFSCFTLGDNENKCNP